MRRIRIKHGKSFKYVLVDDEDYDLINSFSWYFTDHGYARAYNPRNGKGINLHHLLIKRTGKLVVDHINGNPLDNRKANLRLLTDKQNISRAKRKSNGSSNIPYKGVSRNKKKYAASVTVGGKKRHLGSYKTMKEAAKIYNKAALEAFGEYAYQNPV